MSMEKKVRLGSSTTASKTQGRSALGTETRSKDSSSYEKTQLGEPDDSSADETVRISDEDGPAADAATELAPSDRRDDATKTELSPDQKESLPERGTNSGTSKRKRIIPDVRSDIYSVGATLYHLLSGVRPAKDALEVVPLSEEEFSPQVVKIITKAMNPNPDLRYQTAAEMLQELRHLHQNDPRVRRLKRQAGIGSTLILAVSFSDGSLLILDVRNYDDSLIVFDGSEFTHFEGGFFGKYLAFSSTGEEQSVFAVIDTEKARQTGGFSSTMPFHVRADGTGIYVSTENILVKIDPESGEQEEVAYTDADITGFCKDGDYTITATVDDAFSFFGVKATFLEKNTEEMGVSFVSLAGPTAVVGRESVTACF